MFAREYEIKTAVADISFKIDKGEIVGYIGPNGAGKSTTVKTLAGILVLISGRVEVGGSLINIKARDLDLPKTNIYTEFTEHLVK